MRENLIEDFPKVTIILRDYTYEETKTVLDLLSKSKFKSVEIALNTDGSKEIIGKIVKEYKDKLLIGAGTVLNKQDLEDVIKLGVDFVLSPIAMNKEMLEICKANNVVSVPGAYSSSEIMQSFTDGADIVKVFPAKTVGPSYFKQIMSPLGKIKLMAVGGVNEQNAKEYFENGASYVGIGSGIFNKEDIRNGEFNKIQDKLEHLEEVLEL